jgi:predicted S18 family serine protease
MKKGVVSLLVLLIILSFPSLAQVDTAVITLSDKQVDSIKQPQKHSPTTAVLLSIIPGGGQIYNKKWWKVPIIYAVEYGV